MAVPGKCSECHRAVLRTFHVDGSPIELCYRCIAKQMREAEQPIVLTAQEIIRRLYWRPYI